MMEECFKCYLFTERGLSLGSSGRGVGEILGCVKGETGSNWTLLGLYEGLVSLSTLTYGTRNNYQTSIEGQLPSGYSLES